MAILFLHVNNNLHKNKLMQIRFAIKWRTDGNEVVEFSDINTTQYIAFLITNTGDILTDFKIINSSSFNIQWGEGKGNIGIAIVMEY